VSACHAEGRGFEPRRSRHFLLENGSYWMVARSGAAFGRLTGAPAFSFQKMAVFKNSSQQRELFPLPSFAGRKGRNFPVFLRRIFL
jgi:hypothetical protein